MENKSFKYRPEIKGTEDLQPGDEFLVGDERWLFTGETERANLTSVKGLYSHSYYLARDLIRANVPIERDIPYPEGGAERWELFERRDGEPCPPSARMEFYDGKWISCEYCYLGSRLVAIPKAKPAPKEYTVEGWNWKGGYIHILGDDFKPGDRVTVQRVEK